MDNKTVKTPTKKGIIAALIIYALVTIISGVLIALYAMEGNIVTMLLWILVAIINIVLVIIKVQDLIRYNKN